MAKTIDSQVREILETSLAFDGVKATIARQLDRPTYEQVNKVLVALGGKWSRKDKAHVFPSDARSLVLPVVESGEAPRRNPLAFYPTPSDVVRRMIQVAGLPWDDRPADGYRVLEPSAGDGAIAGAIARHNCDIALDVVEVDPNRAEQLGRAVAGSGVPVVADFLAWEGKVAKDGRTLLYDRILMNPPFSAEGNADAYADHVFRAVTLLKPGGRLVAAVPITLLSAERGRPGALRSSVFALGGSEPIREDAFREAGTAVRTALIWIDMPAEGVAAPGPKAKPKAKAAPKPEAKPVASPVAPLKVSDYRNLISSLGYALSSLKSAVGPDEVAREGAWVRKAVDALNGATCPRSTERDRRRARNLIAEAEACLARRPAAPAPSRPITIDDLVEPARLLMLPAPAPEPIAPGPDDVFRLTGEPKRRRKAPASVRPADLAGQLRMF